MEFLYSILDFLRRLLSQKWFWILVAVAVALILLLVLYRKLKTDALSHLEYARYFSSDGVFAGESFEMVEVVHNPTMFPLFFVNMDFFIPAGLTVNGVKCYEYKKCTSTFHIPPRATAKKVHEVISEKRDHYKLKNVSLVYRKNEFTFEAPIEIYVYPDKYYDDVDLSELIRLTGDAIANKKYVEDPFFFSGIRRYNAGDSMRQVNFKASVRSFSGGVRQLMCNFYESSRNFDTMIYLDLTEYHVVEGYEKYCEALERGLRCACYLFCQAQTYGGKVGFVTNSSTEDSRYVNIPCDTGNLHTKKILECFAEITPYARHDFSMNSLLQDAIKLPNGTDIYLITPYVDDKNAELIRSLERVGKSVSVIKIQVGEA